MKAYIRILSSICTACSVVSFAAGCGNDGKEKAEMGPEDVIEAFSRAVASGDFETAYNLCDTASMKTYLDEYMAAWEMLQEKDSSALAIASSILSGAEMKIEKVDKDGEDRIISYSLEAEGNVKERKARVRKEEGEWKVQEITDAI